MPSQASAASRALESEFVGRLARFFPEATPVRIPIRLSRAACDEKGKGGDRNGNAARGTERDRPNGTSNSHGNCEQNGKAAASNGWSDLQETVIEFGTPQEVLFAVAQPLEFADRVLVESRDGFLRAEASIVAVQYHAERTVVAARFLKPVPNWIVKS